MDEYQKLHINRKCADYQSLFSDVVQVSQVGEKTFRFYTVGQTKQDLGGHHQGLMVFYFLNFTTRWIAKRAYRGQLVK